jgi:hypothetical protein
MMEVAMLYLFACLMFDAEKFGGAKSQRMAGL